MNIHPLLIFTKENIQDFSLIFQQMIEKGKIMGSLLGNETFFASKITNRFLVSSFPVRFLEDTKCMSSYS